MHDTDPESIIQVPSRGSASKPLPTMDQSESRGGSSKLRSTPANAKSRMDDSPTRKLCQEMQERLLKLESENKEMKVE